MKKSTRKIKMIGYRPTEFELYEICYISVMFNISYNRTVRELITGNWTIDELYILAQMTNPKQYDTTVCHLKNAYTMNANLSDIIRKWESLQEKEFLSIEEPEELTL